MAPFIMSYRISISKERSGLRYKKKLPAYTYFESQKRLFDRNKLSYTIQKHTYLPKALIAMSINDKHVIFSNLNGD